MLNSEPTSVCIADHIHKAYYKSETFYGSFIEGNVFRKRFRISKKLVETFGKDAITKQLKYKASKNLAF